MGKQNTFLVTGSTGHIGSMLVLHLLQKSYRVKATVLDPEDKHDLQPLLDIDAGLAKNLEILKADILVEGDFDAAVNGCDGVFHLACPTNFIVDDPHKDIIEPAVKGTLNVLKSCAKSPSVKRIVHVSSAAAIRFDGKDLPDKVYDESCWTDVDFVTENNIPGWPYFVGKTLGEKAAAQFAKEQGLDVVVVNPALVCGPFLISRIPNSVKDSLALITGDLFKLPFLKRLNYVHIYDLVKAFIFLYEHPSANGRYICSSADASIGDIVKLITTRYPEFKIPTDLSYLGDPEMFCFDSSKLKNLGFQYECTLEDMFDGSISCCRDKGLL